MLGAENTSLGQAAVAVVPDLTRLQVPALSWNLLLGVAVRPRMRL